MSAQNALKFSRPRRSLQISFKWLSSVENCAPQNERSLHAVFLHLEKFLRAPLLSAAYSELYRPTSMLSIGDWFRAVGASQTRTQRFSRHCSIAYTSAAQMITVPTVPPIRIQTLCHLVMSIVWFGHDFQGNRYHICSGIIANLKITLCKRNTIVLSTREYLTRITTGRQLSARIKQTSSAK